MRISGVDVGATHVIRRG